MLKRRRSEEGSAMLITTIILLILVGVSGAYMTVSWANKRRASLDLAATQALYIAEAGAAQYVANLNSGAMPTPTAVAPQYVGGGYYWVPAENLVNFSDATVVGTVNSTENAKGQSYIAFQVAGKFGGVTRRLDVIANHQPGGPFNNAVAAFDLGDPSRGNIKDPNYTLSFQGATSGTTTTSDTVNGNIYSGGNVSLTGPVNMAGQGGVGNNSITYSGSQSSSITGPTFSQGTEPSFNIPKNFGPNGNMSQAQYNATQYANGARDSNGVAWVDVGAQFNSGAATANHTWVDGSTATDILNQQNPAHIFRKNPSSTSGASINRTQHYEHTINTTTVGPAGNTRNDYYLEDPTSTQVTQPSLTGVAVNGDTTASMVNIQPSGNNAVYYIPGNMRVSGEPIKSYQLDPASGTGPIQMTFVVQGNVSLTDNILYPHWESTTDSIAIIAITDPNYPNSVPADFASGGTAPITPYGVSATQFVTDYNNRAATARSQGLNIPNLDMTNPADQYKASEEYNKIYGSGNVFFGDPGSGTVEHFEGFLYAENNFYATDLDTTTSSGGTKDLSIWGTMSAGNQIHVDRTTTQTATGMIPFSVFFDPAILNGHAPPGIPATPSSANQPWVISSWRQSANTAETTQK